MSGTYDIVINGAGIPGMTLALLLARQASGLSIALLEKNPRSKPQTKTDRDSVEDFDLRVYALTEASKECLQKAGAWADAEADQAAANIWPYQHMHVWDSGEPINQRGDIEFDAADIGVTSLGYIVESVTLQRRLLESIEQTSGIHWIEADELTTFTETSTGLDLTLQSGGSISCKLLVGADGAQSTVKQLAGIQDIGWSYHQRAVVTTVQPEQHHQHTAWQRFLPGGPLAFLPMKDNFCSIVWTVSEQRAQELCDMDAEFFQQTLAESFEQTLGEIKSVGPRASFPLKLIHAREYVANRVALIADAAHVVHPLAGQGLNLGLQDVAALAKQIMNAVNANTDIGLRRYLRAYERSRKGDNWLMQGSFDGLNRLFGNEQAFLAHLRNRGLNWVNRVPVIRNQFARKAAG